MKSLTSICRFRRAAVCGVLGIVLACGNLLAVDGDPAGAVLTTAAIHTLGTSQQSNPLSDSPLPDGVLALDGLAKETNMVADAGYARFTFNFTNVSSGDVVIRDVEPSCSCTTAQLPPLPWVVPTGANGQFSLTVNLLGKARNQVKTAYVRTDQGSKELMLKINILPPVFPAQSKADRARALKIAQADRQAVFHGDCAVCHVKPGEGKDGRALYYAICATCHEGTDRIATTPDLFAIRTPTNVVFWIDQIAHGKPGTLMPAFSTDEGGPLSEMQIAYLARFLNTSDYHR